jgi:hypothetical protein
MKKDLMDYAEEERFQSENGVVLQKLVVLQKFFTLSKMKCTLPTSKGKKCKRCAHIHRKNPFIQQLHGQIC